MDALARKTGTLHLPQGRPLAAPPAPKLVTPPAPKPETKPARASKPARAPKGDKFALPGNTDLAVELAPEHRVGPPKVGGATRTPFALEVLEATRGVPREPLDTRALRLTLAAAEAFPAHTPSSLSWTLKSFIDQAPEKRLADAARELRGAISSTTSHARMARFTPMLIGSIAVIEQRRDTPREDRKETETTPNNDGS